jgi:hypothetical protein
MGEVAAQMGEVAAPPLMFADMLSLIACLRARHRSHSAATEHLP